MKIQKLDLKKFGPFAEKSLDFSQAANRLTIVFGPNEAGKSSSLRGLRQLLYGIPARDFIYAAKDLRLAGHLVHSDGTDLKITRRKGKSQALRDESDKVALDESVLHRFLGGLAQNHFESMFGIDHSDLIAGGQALFSGKGELGQILFSAGAGIGDINRISEGLSKSAGELFLARGTTPVINLALQNLRDAQAKLKSLEVLASEWEQLEQSLQKATTKKTEIENDINQKQQIQGKLQRIKDALPLVAQRLELQKAADGLKDAGTILLPENFGDRSRELQLELKRATTEQELIVKTLETLDEQLAQMQIPTGLIDRASVIEDLQQKLGSHRKAMHDRSSNVVVNLTERENAMKAALKSLGYSPDLEQCDSLRITVANKTLIRDLATKKSAVEGNRDNASTQLALLNKNIGTTEAALSKLASPAAPELLVKSIKRMEQKGALETQLKLARGRSDSAADQLIASVRRLLIGDSTVLSAVVAGHDWEQLASLISPGLETIERFQSDMDKYARGFETLNKSVVEVDENLREISQQLEKLRLEMDTPTEADLADARASRELGWQKVRGAWVAASIFDAEAADKFEHDVLKADNLSDRLRRESAQIAERAQLMAETAKLTQKRSENLERIAKGDLAQKKLDDSWVDAWSGVALNPLPPREMRSWALNFQEALKLVSAARESQAAWRELDEQVVDAKAELKALLAANDLDLDAGHSAGASLATLLEKCQQIVSEIVDLRGKRAILERDLDKYRTDLIKVEQDHQSADAAMQRWDSEWLAAVKPLGLAGVVLPVQANAHIDTLDLLFTNQSQAQDLTNRLHGIDRDATHFKASVREIALFVAPDLVDFPAEQAAVELSSRLSKARLDKERLDLLGKQRQEKIEAQLLCTTRIGESKNELDLMCQQASCNAYENLGAAAESSKLWRANQTAMTQVEKGLLALSGGLGLNEFMSDVAAIEADNVAPTITQLGVDVERLKAEKEEHVKSIGRDSADLDRINGNGLAAETAEEIQALLAKIATYSEQYARLHIAEVLLKQCVARYREKNQSPVLKRASTIFEALTLGSFISLREEYGDKGESILVAVRPDEQQLGLSEMSEGTCDQAYLGLRLASLEIYLENHEPLPFIVDDILVNFDDARSHAALSILTELAQRTQVIFFTHHNHIVELAQDKLGEEKIWIEDLLKGTRPLQASR